MTTRREFLRTLALAGTSLAGLGYGPRSWSQANTYTGKFLVNVQFIGGWDVTSFCDPKENIPGELEINHWARTATTEQIGNLRYAPFSTNAQFFQKYHERMLVINGVDAQTNAHDVGEIVTWSGRTAQGYPSLTALMAAEKAPDLALSYLNFGGFGNTESIIRSSRINNPESLKNIIFPNTNGWQPDQKNLLSSDWERIQAQHLKTASNLSQSTTLLAQDRLNRQYYADAMSRAESIKAFGNLIPNQDQIEQPTAPARSYSTIRQQAQMSLLAFKAGVSISADLIDGGYDTHSKHDRDHPVWLENTLDGVDYLWDYAEELGIADRLVVVLGSDFGRTPHYNADEGKDHWPIGSYVIMEKNVGWSDRAVGETDEGHNAFSINPNTLARDDAGGTIIYTRHVHKALRDYLGLNDSQYNARFPFNNTEDFRFFS